MLVYQSVLLDKSDHNLHPDVTWIDGEYRGDHPQMANLFRFVMYF